MYRTHNLKEPPPQLAQYLSDLRADVPSLRRRAIISRAANDAWNLVCCTVQAFPPSLPRPEPVESRNYSEAILHEEWLTPAGCSEFIEMVRRGKITLSDITLEREGGGNWYDELLPLRNNYMDRAGFCTGTTFRQKTTHITQVPLLSPGEPYFPDLAEAARHWLPFPAYHGDSDARNQQIIFLFPEARAFFVGATRVEGGRRVAVQGTKSRQLDLTVKGAYWTNGRISHFEDKIEDGSAFLHLPNDVDRLEYALVDSKGTLYDFQNENRFNDAGLGQQRLDGVDDDIVAMVRAACEEGEGPQIEFKPFIKDLKKMGTPRNKEKIRELVTTVVAFSNTKGGCVYVGIDDECGLTDITHELQKWAQQDRADPIKRYCGALRNAIRGKIEGDLSMQVSHATVDGALVIIVNVDQSPSKPVMVTDDNLLYVRVGSNNKQLPPTQWASVLGPSASGGLPPPGFGN